MLVFKYLNFRDETNPEVQTGRSIDVNIFVAR